MELRPAREEELPVVRNLYKSVIGTPFCYWNENYPSDIELYGDYRGGNLYVLCEDSFGGENGAKGESGIGGNDKIIGALSVVDPKELEGEADFAVFGGAAAEIARIVVDKSCRGRGLAYKMVMSIIGILKERGYRAVHLSVAAGNEPAIHTYKKAGFEFLIKKPLYGGEYYIIEKVFG